MTLNKGGYVGWVEPQEVAPLDEWDFAFLHESPDVAYLDAKLIGDADDVDESWRIFVWE